MRLPFTTLVDATHGTVLHFDAVPRDVRVTTDTRSIEPGDCFLALRGERFDGHQFTHQAVAAGARAVVISDDAAAVPGVTALLVPDTLRAYMAIAAAARDRFQGDVIGITGSAGKTTTKVFLAQLLALRFGDRVLASPANENNEIGVSKLLLNADNAQHDCLIVEMGARHYNDISPLVEIARPRVGVLTNVGEAHLEIMGSRERLEETKWGLFSLGAIAVLNARDAASRARAGHLLQPVHWFDAGPALDGHVRPLTGIVGRDRFVEREAVEERFACDVRVPGAHNLANAAAAAAAARECGVGSPVIAAALSDLRMPSGRYEAVDLANGARGIYDAYNANASGMHAALAAFAEERASRHIAVLGSMAELGDEALRLHREVGARAASLGLDALLVGGDFADALAEGAQRAGLSSERIAYFASNAEAARWLREHLQAGDAVLFKGSRKYKLEEIIEELRPS